MIMKNISYIICCFVTFIYMNGCKKFVTIPTPKNQITTAQVFADSADAAAAILNVYITSGGLSNGINGYGMSLIPGLSSDELYQTGSNSDYQQFYVNNVLPANSTNLGLWSGAYTNIYNANACISGITGSTGISAAAKTQLVSEAKFIRAFEFFYLVNLYGAVPLPVTTDYIVNADMPRTAPPGVYALIISDLTAAEQGLPPYAGTNTRPTASAASALLAKVYLYDGKYALAQAEAAKVINSGNFALENNLNNVFLTTSREIIWQLASISPNEGSGDGLVFVPSSAATLPRYVITPSLFNSFESGDMRKSAWITVNVVNGTSYPFPYKYKLGVTTSAIDEYEVLLRLADIYLIRAEAEANQNDETDAAKDINVIRNRAGLQNTTATTQAELLQVLQNERRWEFFCERGNRWFDLKRWNLATTALSPVKTGWDPHDQLYPVPEAQINDNPYLTQNAGY